MVTEQSDAGYAERLSRSVATRFLDTNQFSLVDVPQEERILIGAETTRHVGSRHDPEVAKRALDESASAVKDLLGRYSVVIVIATGGKGTGAGTIVPVTQMARQHKQLVIPIFVRPSFERHEVEKRRFDHALAIGRQLDAAGIRFMEILNDSGYVDSDPQPQSVVWERMNVPIARALRGLLYVLWDLSQVDPSDLSSLFAGPGRLRMGFSELDPPSGAEPSDDQLERAVHGCWENPFCCFKGPVGTSLICIHGEWSNIADARIKSRLAALAAGSGQNFYNPLYARAFHAPKPWGITTVFAEHTGNHAPVDIDLALATEFAAPERPTNELVAVARQMDTLSSPATVIGEATSFSSFREFALALNRADPSALALAQDGDTCALTIDELEVRKLLGTFWFRSVFARLSPTWRERVLTVLSEGMAMPNHVLKVGRQDIRVSDLNHAQLKELSSKTFLPDAVQADLHLLIAIGNLWGQEGLDRVRFNEQSAIDRSAKVSGFFQGFRKSES